MSTWMNEFVIAGKNAIVREKKNENEERKLNKKMWPNQIWVEHTYLNQMERILPQSTTAGT